jgi:hypothetical protein
MCENGIVIQFFVLGSLLVFKELRFRSAPSLGTFQLIRQLYDEYMFYLTQHQVARPQLQYSHVPKLVSNHEDISVMESRVTNG